MTTIRCSLRTSVECEFNVTETELGVMAAHGVDTSDEYAVSAYYRDHIAANVDGCYFLDLFSIASEHRSEEQLPEIEEWGPA